MILELYKVTERMPGYDLIDGSYCRREVIALNADNECGIGYLHENQGEDEIGVHEIYCETRSGNFIENVTHWLPIPSVTK